MSKENEYIRLLSVSNVNDEGPVTEEVCINCGWNVFQRVKSGFICDACGERYVRNFRIEEWNLPVEDYAKLQSIKDVAEKRKYSKPAEETLDTVELLQDCVFIVRLMAKANRGELLERFLVHCGDSDRDRVLRFMEKG